MEQSRNEKILAAMIDGIAYTAPPQSREEELLLELKEVIEQGGTITDVDDELSSTSKNPVQNKVITTALDGYIPNAGNNNSTTFNLTRGSSDGGASLIVQNNGNIVAACSRTFNASGGQGVNLGGTTFTANATDDMILSTNSGNVTISSTGSASSTSGNVNISSYGKDVNISSNYGRAIVSSPNTIISGAGGSPGNGNVTISSGATSGLTTISGGNVLINPSTQYHKKAYYGSEITDDNEIATIGYVQTYINSLDANSTTY